MTHDPLCPQQPRDDGATLTLLDGTPVYCACDLIASVRQDMLAKCIAAVEALEPLLFVDKHHGGYDCCGCSTLDALHEDALAAMRALQEKP